MGSEPPSRQARAACHSARDAFYDCVRQQEGLDFKVDQPVPPKCREARKAFEKECLPSWVSAGVGG